MNKIFIPHELKTIEVDTEKKIFRINGENFGDGCTGFTISCTPGEFKIRVCMYLTLERALEKVLNSISIEIRKGEKEARV